MMLTVNFEDGDQYNCALEVSSISLHKPSGCASCIFLFVGAIFGWVSPSTKTYELLLAQNLHYGAINLQIVIGDSIHCDGYTQALNGVGHWYGHGLLAV